MRRRLRLLLLAPLLPAALFAESATPSIRYTGVPADSGGVPQTCAACHNTPPPGAATGSLSVTINDYTPNVNQLVKIMVQDPIAQRWGFQITIRQVSDETQEAGNLTVINPNDPTQVRCDDGSKFGSPGPCTGTREFGEQLNAPHTTVGAPVEFDLNWLPPPNEVGDLHVYVTAVAGNGDGSTAGDRVYSLVKTISAVGGCSLTKRPTLQTVSNGASFKPQFSANSMISIFGLGFQVSGRTRTAGAGDFVNNSFPTTLSCVSVLVTGPGIPSPGVMLPIAYVQQDQINAQAPMFSGGGPVNLTVIINAGKPNELRSDVGMLTALDLAPAFFVFGTTTSIAAQVAGTATIIANPAVVPGGRPARSGDLITLYGTGFGATNPPVATGALATGQATLTNPITVMIGGITLSSSDVLYAGLSPQSISGLYQFNVRVPAGLPNGDVPVVITIGGVQTQSGATIPIQQ